MAGGRRTPVEDFWENRVLGMTNDIHDQGNVRWELVGCLAIAWLICWLSICKGVKSSGKVAWVTAIYPYMVLTALLIRAVTLPGAREGIIFYLKPDFSKLLETEVKVHFAYSLTNHLFG